MSKNIKRREFIKLFAWTVALPSYALAAMNFKPSKTGYEPCFATAYMNKDRTYGIAIIDKNYEVLSLSPLPNRGHASTFSSASGWLVTFARRPHNFAMALNLKTKQTRLFKAPKGYHFYGHGTFNSNGSLLYSTENNFSSMKGIIGIYDAFDNFKRVGEFESGELGPHDIKLLSDGSTFCVANGGILTHPDTGRQKLNLDTMQSSITMISGSTGDILKSYNVPYQRLSLRHMTLSPDKSIWIAGQYQGYNDLNAPLLAKIEPKKKIKFIDFETQEKTIIKNYINSITTYNNGNRLAISSSKGHQLIIIDTKTNKIIEKKRIKNVSGLCQDGEKLLYSTMSGKINSKKSSLYWDNHITALT